MRARLLVIACALLVLLGALPVGALSEPPGREPIASMLQGPPMSDRWFAPSATAPWTADTRLRSGHGWLLLPVKQMQAGTPREWVLLHVPARGGDAGGVGSTAGDTPGAGPGTLKVAGRFTAQAQGLAAWENRVYLTFSPELMSARAVRETATSSGSTPDADSRAGSSDPSAGPRSDDAPEPAPGSRESSVMARRVVSVSAVQTIAGTWDHVPLGGAEARPPLEGQGILASFVGSEAGPLALMEPDPYPLGPDVAQARPWRLRALVGDGPEWVELSLPRVTDFEPARATQTSGAAGATRARLLAVREGAMLLIQRHPDAPVHVWRAPLDAVRLGEPSVKEGTRGVPMPLDWRRVGEIAPRVLGRDDAMIVPLCVIDGQIVALTIDLRASGPGPSTSAAAGAAGTAGASEPHASAVFVRLGLASSPNAGKDGAAGAAIASVPLLDDFGSDAGGTAPGTAGTQPKPARAGTDRASAASATLRDLEVGLVGLDGLARAVAAWPRIEAIEPALAPRSGTADGASAGGQAPNANPSTATPTTLPMATRVGVAELSIWDGARAYAGVAKRESLLTARDIQVLAFVLGAVMLAVVAFVLRSDSTQALALPTGVALCPPSQRAAAALLDAALPVLAASLLHSVSPAGLVTVKVIASGRLDVWYPMLTAWALCIANATLCQWLFGKTLGMRILGCEVLGMHKDANATQIEGAKFGTVIIGRPTLWQATLRNVIAWGIPPLGLLMLVDANWRHAGDLLAGTVVVTAPEDDDETQEPL